MDDIINWDALRSPSKSVDVACPNCKSTNTKLQTRTFETSRGTVRSNIHCADCGWGWTHVREGHENQRRWFVKNLKRDLGSFDPSEIDGDDELAAWRELVEAVEALADYHDIDYPIETFDEK